MTRPPHAPTSRSGRVAIALALALALAWACGPKRQQLYDRDIGLSDAPVGRQIDREPLEGDLLNGWNALRAGKLAAAQAQLERHLKGNPKSAAAHYHLGLIHMDERRFAQARRHLRRAAELEPNLYGAWSNLGVLFLRNAEVIAAMKAFEKALAIAPDDARVLNNLGNAWLQRGRWSSALDAYERALKIAGEHGTTLYNKALALTYRYEYAEARAILEQVLSIRPGFALARALRVACLQGEGLLAKAEAAGRKDLTLVEPTPDNHVVLGRVLLAAGKVEAGLEQLEAAVDLDKGHAIAVMSWAEALDAAGRKSEAKHWYGRYLKLEDRLFEDSRRIRRRLKALSRGDKS